MQDEAKTENSAAISKFTLPENPPENKPEKAVEPILKNAPAKASKFSILKKLEASENAEQDEKESGDSEELPSNHFTETDLQQEWTDFLHKIQQEDMVVYNAIQGFKIEKSDENLVKISYPSETAKAEFDKVSGMFLNAFKHKVNNFRVEVLYHLDAKSMKRELETKRSVFEKMAAKNPLLRELDDIFKFDFNS